ncbi:MAG: protein kinase [Pseudomonadota bacterium]
MVQDLETPRVIDEFQLQRVVGKGAMGEVWLAWDSLLERQVAVKLVKPEMPVSIRGRLLCEGRVLAKLHHPNVIAVHAAGELGKWMFLITELLEGRSLAEISKPVPADRLLEIGVGLVRGLAAIHSLGIVHRDIKPANSFECRDGSLKLIDFGLARLGIEEEGADAFASTQVLADSYQLVHKLGLTMAGSGTVRRSAAIAGSLHTGPDEHPPHPPGKVDRIPDESSVGGASAATGEESAQPVAVAAIGDDAAVTAPESEHPPGTAPASATHATATHVTPSPTATDATHATPTDAATDADATATAAAATEAAAKTTDKLDCQAALLSTIDAAGDATQEDELAGLPMLKGLEPFKDTRQALSRRRLIGTPLYAAPEVWRGEEVSPQSDIYSLGALLFELATGAPPYRARTLVELAGLVIAGPPARLTGSLADGLADLAPVIESCLGRDPNTRPSTTKLREVLEAQQERQERRRAATKLLSTGSIAKPSSRPYRGLLPFGFDDQADFFGRDAETRAVIAQLRSLALLLVTGASGVGKSSLVRAGVAPRAMQGALGDGARRVITVVPGVFPVESMATAAASLVAKNREMLAERLRNEPGWLAEELRARGDGGRTLVVIDQLEEVWTVADLEGRATFLQILAELVGAAPVVRVLATIRADFLDRIGDLASSSAGPTKGIYVLAPLSAEGIRRAIVEPAQLRGYFFEPDSLPDALVGKLITGGPGMLPLLQFAMMRLWERRDRTRRRLTGAALDSLGGIEGAIVQHADDVLRRMPAPARNEARRVLLALVTPLGTRARREEWELVEGFADQELARQALRILVDGRLVVATRGEVGPVYEVAHEVLLAAWPTLRAWLLEESAHRAVAARVERASAEWERQGRSRDALWRGRQLVEAQTLDPGRLTEGERAFLAAGERARQWRRACRFAFPLALLLTALVAAGVAGAKDRGRQHERLARQHELGQRLVAEADGLAAQARAAQADSFARFDAREDREGERAWAEATALAAHASELYSQATAELEKGLYEVPGDRSLVTSAAAATYQWLLLAERHRSSEPALVEELRSRLKLYDDDAKSWQEKLAAPVSLDLTVVPPQAKVRRHQLVAVEDGPLVAEPGQLLDVQDGRIRVELDPGSYLFEAEAAGRYRTLYPLYLGHDPEGRTAVTIMLPEEKDVPHGFRYVPAGMSLVGYAGPETIRQAINAEPRHSTWVDAFLIAEHEVTFASYLEFLASLPATEARTRAPADMGSLRLEPSSSGWQQATLRLSIAGAGQEASVGPHQPLCRPTRVANRCQDWSTLAVAGVSWFDARAYAAWLDKTGRVPGARLCTAREWERAGAGADGRQYAHGNEIRALDANILATYDERLEELGIDTVGSHPRDASPFVVADMNGNVSEWVDSRSPLDATRRESRGGSWDRQPERLSSRHWDLPDSRRNHRGIRICASLPGR